MNTNNKLTALKAVNLLTSVLADTPYEVLKIEAGQKQDDAQYYIVHVTLGVTANELLQVVPLLEEVAFKHNAHVKAQTADGRTGVDIHNALDDVAPSLIDEMIEEVKQDAQSVYGGEFTVTQQDGHVKLKRDDDTVEIDFTDQELQYLQKQEQTLSGSDTVFQAPVEEKQYNQELLDLGDLDEQLSDLTSAKPAKVQDAQKQPKVVRRRQEKPKIDEAETSEALAKRKPKSVTVAQNMTPRVVSRDELNNLASAFTGDWEKDLEPNTDVAE